MSVHATEPVDGRPDLSSVDGRSPLVVFGDDWGRNVSTMQHLFRFIIPSRPVVWVNGIGHRIPSFADLGRAVEKATKILRATRAPAAPPSSARQGWADVRPLAVIEPSVMPWHNLAPVYAYNVWSLQRSIRGALDEHGLTDPPVVVTGSPPSAGVLGRLGEVASVYLCMDDFLHLQGTSPRMLAPLERRLLDRVDVVVATATHLTRTKVPTSGRVHYLPQGVNYDHFATPQREPPEMADLPRPVVGFAGGVSACCDLELISALADAHPEGSVVLVGPVAVDTTPLTRPNVHLLGPRPYGDLPGYVQAFDVGIIPYVLNEWTRAVDPLKLLEYLAGGIPVVTTEIPEVLKYREVVSVAADRRGFLEAVDAALQADRSLSRSRGRAVARQHTWESRANELCRVIDDVTPASPDAGSATG